MSGSQSPSRYLRELLRDLWDIFLTPFRWSTSFTIFGEIEEFRERRRRRRLHNMEAEVQAELQRAREQKERGLNL
ncbi:MAG: hypothetical protein AAF725_02920 [Acidobacteriota bacterium]